MSALDIFILACLAAGLVHGFTTGVIRQIASVISLIFGFLIALQLMHPIGRVLTSFMGVSEQYAPVVGFIAVFLLFHLAIILLVKLFETVLEVLKLTAANRILGSMAGAIKATLILGIVFLALGYVEVPDERSRAESTLYGPVTQVLPGTWEAVRTVFPQVNELSQKFTGEVRDIIDDGEILDTEAIGDAVESAADKVSDSVSGD